ncbi:MAG: ribonuclease P protein component [Bacteroidales bacterium]|nr:ribonuclease P protein component [Bacteroidales bacterium]
MSRFSFGREEKLKSRKSIESLFSSGKSFSSPPIRLLYRENDIKNIPSVQVGVIVPKRYFKRAVDRNLLKRRIREAYRTTKQDLFQALESKRSHLEIVFIYQSTEIKNSQEIRQSINFLLYKLKETILQS